MLNGLEWSAFDGLGRTLLFVALLVLVVRLRPWRLLSPLLRGDRRG